MPQPEQPATCTEPGVKAYYECSVCGAPFKDAACDTPIADLDSWKVIQALGHDWGVWASNGDDTHTRTCRRPDCGEVEKEACTGGEATYFLQAVCERCGGAYGPLEEDTWYPAGEISVEGINDTIFDKFLDPGKITFDSFVFGRSLRVSITADDDSQHVGGYTPDKAPKVEYYIHSGGTALSFAEVQQKEFTPYQGVFTIRPDDKLVIYAKITDYAGNTAWISSDGIVLDATAPGLTGVENGASYYVTQALKASDENLNTVTVNGEAVAADFTLTGDTKATYAVVVTDKAGNVTSVTVEMKPLSDLEKVMEGLTEQTVTSGDRPRLQALEACVYYPAATPYVNFWSNYASDRLYLNPGEFTAVSTFVPQQRYKDHAADCIYGDLNQAFADTEWAQASGWSDNAYLKNLLNPTPPTEENTPETEEN